MFSNSFSVSLLFKHVALVALAYRHMMTPTLRLCEVVVRHSSVRFDLVCDLVFIAPFYFLCTNTSRFHFQW